MKKPGEVVTVQALRAIAAVLVICAHASTMRLDLGFGTIGVDIFFAVSGFVMIIATRSLASRPHPARTFLRRRFLRIVPMYWLFIGLAVVAAYHYRLPHSLGLIATSLLFIPFNSGVSAEHYFPILAVGWTLSYEMLFYVCFAICLALRRSPFWLAPAFAILSIVGFHNPIQPTGIFSLLNYRLLEFVAGMAIAWLFLRQRVLPKAAAMLACAACIAAVAYWPRDTYHIHMAIWAPAALLFSYAVLSFESLLSPRMPRVLEWIADASYSIYLCHQQFVLFAFRRIAAKLLPLDLWQPHTLAFLSIAICCVVGVLIHFMIERPLLRYFSVRIGGHA